MWKEKEQQLQRRLLSFLLLAFCSASNLSNACVRLWKFMLLFDQELVMPATTSSEMNKKVKVKDASHQLDASYMSSPVSLHNDRCIRLMMRV